ncbi:MAG: polymorphic toxin type 24 domain-containing protein [Moraxella sp.]|nr:polymorphic toxin type 24 domain-containing protein [Moraxella sp.]
MRWLVRSGSKSRNKPPAPDPQAKGYPHTIIEKVGRDGQYTTYNEDGSWKQYRGSGKPHGNIEKPNVKELSMNEYDGKKYPSKPEVRYPREDEYPR